MSFTLRNNNASCRQPIANNFRSIDFERSDDAEDFPITLAEAKTHIVVDFTDDDDYITTLIAQCIEAIEKETNTCILIKTVFVLVDVVKEFELPYCPLSEFTSAEIKTSINTYSPMVENSDYEIDNDLQFSRFIPFKTGRMKLIYEAGYGDDIPDSLKLAVLNEIAFRYENRGDSTNRYAQQNVGISEGAQALAAPFKRLAWV